MRHKYIYQYKTGITRVKTKLAIAFSAMGVGAAGVFGAASILGTAHAANNITVYPGNVQWSTADTRTGGNVNFVTDASAPGGSALSLTTDSTTAAKAQYIHAANTPIGDVSELSYMTKQNSVSFAQGDPSYQLLVCLTGVNSSGGCNANLTPTTSAPTSFTTFVYEPYQGGQGSVGTGWQTWNIDSTGLFWSSKSVTCSGGSYVAGAGGNEIYTLANIQATCPQAVVIGFGVNIGTYNPSYDVETDMVSFNGTAYDFQNGASTLATPTITSPANGANVTSAQLDKIDWTDVTGAVTYQYRAYSDSSYTNLIYDSGPTLTSSEIPTPGTPNGQYYIQVRAIDGDGNVSAWSNDSNNQYVINVVPAKTPASKTDCMSAGWATMNTPSFPNQGLCVSWVEHNVLHHGTPAANKPSH